MRRAALVELNHKADRIIFVIPTKTKNNVDIGRRSFPVTTTNHKGEYDRNNPVQLYDLDDTIRNIITDTLTAKENLKLAFQAHTNPYFDSRLNWLEICSLVAVATVRWHQWVETITPNTWDNRYSTGAPPAVLLAMKLKTGPNALDSDYSNFGGTKAVTGLDHRVARLAKARGYPIMRIGSWQNVADLAFAVGMGVYDTFNVEALDRILERIFCSNHDYVKRGRFLGKGFEAFYFSNTQQKIFHR